MRNHMPKAQQGIGVCVYCNVYAMVWVVLDESWVSGINMALGAYTNATSAFARLCMCSVCVCKCVRVQLCAFFYCVGARIYKYVCMCALHVLIMCARVCVWGCGWVCSFVFGRRHPIKKFLTDFDVNLFVVRVGSSRLSTSSLCALMWRRTHALHRSAALSHRWM